MGLWGLRWLEMYGIIFKSSSDKFFMKFNEIFIFLDGIISSWFFIKECDL